MFRVEEAEEEKKKTDFCCIKTMGSRQICALLLLLVWVFFVLSRMNERTNEYNNIVELDLNDKKKKKQQKRKTGGLKNINKI